MQTRTTALRTKLFRLTLVILTLVGTGIVAIVASSSLETERHRVRDTEARLSAAINSKAQVLVESQARALRSLVADNALTDLTDIVELSVSSDPEIVYGALITREGEALAYSSPTTLALPKAIRMEGVKSWPELGIAPDSWRRPNSGAREVELFDQQVREVTQPVIDHGEHLGTLVYGFSTAQLKRALAEVRAESNDTLRQTLTGLGLAGALATLLGLVLMNSASRRITDPLGDLTKAANAIARGEKKVRVHLATRDELEVLAAAFNQMQQANEDAMAQLELKTQAALDAARVKGEFLANMSHEIRTPMNGVLGMLRLILARPMDEKLRRFAETAETSAQSLMSIIDEILDFSKLEAGKFDIKSVRFDPGLILQEVVELHASLAQDKGLDLAYLKSSSVSELMLGDPDRLRQVLNNLVGNALKFTEHGEVFVEMTLLESEEHGAMLKTVVQDTGVGIAPEDQSKLFDAFSQLDGSSVRRHGGTGLGLAISRSMVELMGGQIGVVSEVGSGSQFWFTVEAEPIQKANLERLAMPAGRRAIVVESSKRWRAIIEDRLCTWGLVHESFQDTEAALRHLNSGAPSDFDVALVDTRMVQESANSFARALQSANKGKVVPLIALSPLGASELVAGPDAHIAAQVVKPLRMDELYSRIHEVLTGRVLEAPPDPEHSPAEVCGDHGTVLVVDDNEVNQFVAVEQLQLAGFKTATAGSGEEAIQMVRTQEFVAILMDCQMPVVDGYTATRAIRKQEQAGDLRTPVIALTAHAMAGERERVLEAGMDDYLSKPLRPQALEEVLQKHVSSYASPYSTGIRESVAASARTEPNEPQPNLSTLDSSILRSHNLSRLFLSQAPIQLEELSGVVEHEDSRELRAHAHKLKGTCHAVGAHKMAEQALCLEKMADLGSFAGAGACVDALISEFRRVQYELRQEMESGARGPLAQRTSGSPGQPARDSTR